MTMKVFGIAGHSGMGKTTLLARLVPVLVARGLRISLIKHSHKDIEVDRPGKDSYRLREAGCAEVLLVGNARWALMHELRGAPEPALDTLLARLQHCDLVLVEGFKGGDFPKLEVWRAALGKPWLWPAWPGICALACDAPPATGVAGGDGVEAGGGGGGGGRAHGEGEGAGVHGPVRLALEDIEAIADFVLANAVPC